MDKFRIYDEIKTLAENYDIEFDDQYIVCGRGMDCGELCIEYNEDEGYILFAYDRGLKTYWFSTRNADEFKYVVFHKLCSHNGFEYELKNRIKDHYLNKDDDDLKSDTRKIAFEHTLFQLSKINPHWMEKSIMEYEELLNKWRKVKNVYFDREHMQFRCPNT